MKHLTARAAICVTALFTLCNVVNPPPGKARDHDKHDR